VATTALIGILAVSIAFAAVLQICTCANARSPITRPGKGTLIVAPSRSLPRGTYDSEAVEQHDERRSIQTFLTLIGAVCSYFLIERSLSPESLSLSDALIQGFLVGLALRPMSCRHSTTLVADRER
jgi:hypothetical protein